MTLIHLDRWKLLASRPASACDDTMMEMRDCFEPGRDENELSIFTQDRSLAGKLA